MLNSIFRRYDKSRNKFNRYFSENRLEVVLVIQLLIGIYTLFTTLTFDEISVEGKIFICLIILFTETFSFVLYRYSIYKKSISVKNENHDQICRENIEEENDSISVPTIDILNSNQKQKLFKFLGNFFNTKGIDKNIVFENLLNLDLNEVGDGGLIPLETKKIEVGRVLFQIRKIGYWELSDVKKIYLNKVIKSDRNKFKLTGDDFDAHKYKFKDEKKLFSKNVDLFKLLELKK